MLTPSIAENSEKYQLWGYACIPVRKVVSVPFFHSDDALMGREKRLLLQVKYDTIAQKQGSSNNAEDHLGASRQSQTIVSG
jgi:hypothetical protein